MKFSGVTNEDGLACARLIGLLKKGRWDFSGAEAAEFVAVNRWVQHLAGSLAEQLKGTAAAPKDGPVTDTPAPATEGMRIKAMGPLGGSKGKKKR